MSEFVAFVANVNREDTAPLTASKFINAVNVGPLTADSEEAAIEFAVDAFNVLVDAPYHVTEEFTDAIENRDENDILLGWYVYADSSFR